MRVLRVFTRFWGNHFRGEVRGAGLAFRVLESWIGIILEYTIVTDIESWGRLLLSLQMPSTGNGRLGLRIVLYLHQLEC